VGFHQRWSHRTYLRGRLSLFSRIKPKALIDPPIKVRNRMNLETPVQGWSSRGLNGKNLGGVGCVSITSSDEPPLGWVFRV
jgi:hypothetical protein